MLKSIVDFSLRNKLGVLLVTGVITLFCAFSIPDMAIDAVPDITNVQVQVNVKTGALDPENIELQVTRPMEIDFSGIPNLHDMRSISKFGLAQVTLIFEDGTDIYWARQQVSERMNSIRLPNEVIPELAPITTGLGEVFMYTLKVDATSKLYSLSEEEQLKELRTIQDYTIKPHLKRVKGVADVDSNGGFVKEIHINFLPKKMDKFGLTIKQLLAKLESLGVNAGGGYIQFSKEQIIVRTFPRMPDLETISNLSLGINALGIPIKISDVAEVREDHSLRVGAATYAGKESVLGTVLMRIGANGRNVVEGVEEALTTLKLPQGVHIERLYTRKFLVDNTIKTVSTSLVEGAVLVVLILLILLGNIKAAIIVALAIPLSMLVAIRGMNFFGVTGNLMSLGAIDFGLLVDGSVVIIEAILAHLAIEHTRDKSEVLKEAATDVMGPVVSGLLLIMAVYIPILTLEGVEGKMFRPMAITVLLALGASLLIAMFVMPVLSDFFLKNAHIGEDHDTWFFKKAKKIFIPLFDKVLRHPVKAYGSALVLFLVSIFLLTRLGSDFIPELDEGDLVLGLTRNARIGIDASVSEQEKVEKLIMTYPEVEKVFARLGTPESATDPMGVNLADTFIILQKDRKKWRFKTKDELIEALMKDIEKHDPTTEVSATQPIGMRFNEMLEGSRADISLRILGPDLKELFDYGEKAQEIILPIQGVESIEQDPLTALRRGPVLDIKPKFEKMAAYGITLLELNESVEIALAGREVGSFISDNIRFPIVTHMDESLRDDPKEISRIPIELPLGGTIPLSDIATITQDEQITTIARHWGNRYSAVSINVSGRDLGSLVKEAQDKIKEKLNLKEGYTLSWGGQFKNMERANKRLMIIVPLTLLGVFLILWKVFGKLAPTLIVFASVPFAAVGGILALYIRGLHLSVSAGVGFIALIGIALLNSLVLMNVLLTDQSDLSVEERVKKGTLSRLRPVLMTALVAGLGFLPMALNTGIGAEVQRPLATVVIGGLMSSTFLTLFLLPTAFMSWRKRGN
ncbi:efflux RND transporter permease subunit [Peredibacter starrii]|uniref:CusA/CzcA family heavy metal efflux RND transporter n=1 Tax=Peredibacter starrii TaxID=28202 RepID=A0AAX4HTL7_9BACT|nr:CusA/CzcA family heavy metal efflux RND transporter [Peredibacter starrii]WPU66726.1 CusA/CzcA family heavy metal efflux RND transporter [Peredibacter starrii]